MFLQDRVVDFSTEKQMVQNSSKAVENMCPVKGLAKGSAYSCKRAEEARRLHNLSLPSRDESHFSRDVEGRAEGVRRALSFGFIQEGF